MALGNEIKDKLGTLLFWFELVPIGFHSQRPDIVWVTLSFSKAFLVGGPSTNSREGNRKPCDVACVTGKHAAGKGRSPWRRC
jgi:hypothetical protein